jgi:hypothetical protein
VQKKEVSLCEGDCGDWMNFHFQKDDDATLYRLIGIKKVLSVALAFLSK